MFELVQRNVIVLRKAIQDTSDNVHMHLASLSGKLMSGRSFYVRERANDNRLCDYYCKNGHFNQPSKTNV